MDRGAQAPAGERSEGTNDGRTVTGQDDARSPDEDRGDRDARRGPVGAQALRAPRADAFKIEHDRGLDGGREMPPMRVEACRPSTRPTTRRSSRSARLHDRPGPPRAGARAPPLRRLRHQHEGADQRALRPHLGEPQGAEARFFPDEEPQLGRLVCIRVTGYGVRGPMRMRSGYATNVDAWTGTMDLNLGPTACRSGRPRRPRLDGGARRGHELPRRPDPRARTAAVASSTSRWLANGSRRSTTRSCSR